MQKFPSQGNSRSPLPFTTLRPLAKVLTTAVTLSAMTMSAHAATNLVKNGSFENNTGPGVVYGAGGYYQPTTIADWVAEALTPNPLAGVDTYAHAITNTTQAIQLWGAAPGYQNGNGFVGSPDGGYYYIADGDPTYKVRLKQDISGLVVGEKYDLSFDYAFGQEAGVNTASYQNWSVTFGGDTFNTPTILRPEHGFVGWNKSTTTFTATSTTQTLQFLANGPVGGPPMGLLDGVSLTAQAVPGPVPVLGLGATFAWSSRMRKRIKQANLS